VRAWNRGTATATATASGGKTGIDASRFGWIERHLQRAEVFLELSTLLRIRPGRRACEAGMIVGTHFTLFVVPVFYMLIAADHRRGEAEEAPSRDSTGLPAPAVDAA
jgi:hypothetical protein